MSIHQNKLRPPAGFDTKMCNDIERARAATTTSTSTTSTKMCNDIGCHHLCSGS